MMFFRPLKSLALFGGDAALMIPHLLQLVANSVKQYQELKMIHEQSKENKDLLKSINEGLNNAISLLETLPLKDEGILGNLKNFKQALNEVNKIYGDIPKSQFYKMHLTHDQSIAESLKLYNSIGDYTSKQEYNASKATELSENASPKGAARINVQMSAEILHSLNQLIKVNGQMLKLQSESLGLVNKNDKEQTEHVIKMNDDIQKSFLKFDSRMSLSGVVRSD